MKTKPFQHDNQLEAGGSPFVSAYSLRPPKPQLRCDPSEDRTDQSFRQECDINFIMKQYEEIGVIEHLNRLTPQWGEVPDFDFHTSMEMILEAKAKFEALPATLRERFGNDPHNFMEFFGREENRAEGERLGLLNPRETVTPNPATPTVASATPPEGTA